MDQKLSTGTARGLGLRSYQVLGLRSVPGVGGARVDRVLAWEESWAQTRIVERAPERR